MKNVLQNATGKIFYGMHFYPGVAEYSEAGQDPYRVYLNENTIRKMNPTFAGRPIFVEHVDEVEEDMNELRKEADGWVIESFYNAADGKTWVKFIVVSEKAERAIRNHFRLSNAYIPKSFGQGGLWNGVSYAKEVTDGEYEHLAIVKNPRYEESVILTPDEFKAYNENLQTELKRLANSKDQKEKSKMGLKLFKRTKVENAIDLEGMSVMLPKSGKEMTITELVEAHDKIVNMQGYANGDHMVKLGENEMTVNDLVKKHMELNDELESMKKKKEDAAESESDVETEKEPVDVESVQANDDADGDKDVDVESMDNEEDEDEKKKKEAKEAAKKNAADKAADIAAAKKKEAKEKADRLRNAHLRDDVEEEAKVEFSADQVARGKSRYGSN